MSVSNELERKLADASDELERKIEAHKLAELNLEGLNLELKLDKSKVLNKVAKEGWPEYDENKVDIVRNMKKVGWPDEMLVVLVLKRK